LKSTDELASEELRRRRRFELVVQLLHVFEGLDAEVLQELVHEVEWVSLGSGEALFRQGDAADATFFVISGRLRVVLEESAGQRVLSEVGRGETVGEMALLTGDERSATVYAVRDTQLARLSEATFRRFVQRHPPAMGRIAEFVIQRLRRQSAPGGPDPVRLATIAIVPARPSTPVVPFAEGLVAALERHGSAAHLIRSRVEEDLGRKGVAELAEDDPDSIRLVQWLNEREASYRYVVYEADSSWSGWSERAIRQADHVLVVADAQDDPALGENELRLRERGEGARAPEQSLVLLWKSGSPGPGGTTRWLEPRDLDRHHHVRGEEPGDLARLARVLTGNAVGLVLGGGGARGFAHIGVLRALREHGVPVDLIGGTSIGAIIAAQVAAGLDAREIQEGGKRQYASLFDPTLPVVSLLAGRRLGARLFDAFGDIQIEDLAIPFFCVSTNLTEASEVVHRRGALLNAVRASISLPGIFPPIASGRNLLVDGALLNNLPIDVMSGLVAGGRIVAVDVSPEVDMQAAAETRHEVSGWRLLWQRLNPFSRVAPSPHILNVLTRSTLVASIVAEREKQARGAASLYLKIPAQDVGLLAFDAIDEIIERGYEASRDAIRSWWEEASGKMSPPRDGSTDSG
jgi:predicted acylesterase/phospholipase RssA